ncbi:trypsin-like serine protease, partial [Synechococcus sp. MU1644]|nr:trypsin-like serine protease [Synechococcus sp. MU1644]
LDTADLSEGPESRVVAIADIVIHPNYDGDSVRQNDIALLKLSEPWNGKIGHLGLSSTRTQLDGRAYVAGFGFIMDDRNRDSSDDVVLGGLEKLTRADGSPYLAGSRRLRAALVPPVDDDRCEARNNGLIDRESEFCAGFRSGSRDSCNTDSGGPIVQIDQAGCPYLVGIVQSGDWCGARPGQEARFGVYTRISAYRTFIEQHVTSIQAPTAPPETDHQRMLATSDILQNWIDLIPERLDVKMHRKDRPGSEERERGNQPNPYFEGDQMHITFATKTPGDLAIIDMNARGDLTQIHETHISPSFFQSLRGAEFHYQGRLPEDGSAFPAEKPYGEGRLLVIVSPPWAGLRFDSETLSQADDPTSQILEDISSALSGDRNSDDYLGWAITLTPYYIMPAMYSTTD